jgi:hypothetical protein
MKPRPADLDVKALEEAFYAQPSHAGLRTLQTLHDEAQLLVWRTLKELRKFVSAKEDQVQLNRDCEYNCSLLCALGTRCTVGCCQVETGKHRVTMSAAD